MKYFITILTIVLGFGAINCQRQYAEKDFDKNRYLLLNVLEPQQTDVQKSCQAAVAKMNVCVAPGFGFNPWDMCNSNAVGSSTTADYEALATCVSTTIQSLGCNLTNYRYQSKDAAKSAFSSCDTKSLIK